MDVWKDEIASNDAFQFSEGGAAEWGPEDTPNVEYPDIHLSEALCSTILEPTSEEKVKALVVQPQPVKLEVPNIKLTYTAPDGTVYTGMDTINPPITSLWMNRLG